MSFLRSITQVLVDKDYIALEKLSGGERLNASAIEHAVLDYGRTLIMPPDGQFLPDIVPITEHEDTSWSIVLPLYSLEEGVSDLSLELIVKRLDDGPFRIEIEDLHVR